MTLTPLPLRPIVHRFSPLIEFLRSSAAGGVMLMLAAVVALVWANSPLGGQYEALRGWVPPVPVLRMTLEHWTNDGLMAVFFLLVGLELRREMTRGELASVKRLAAPGLAALGGMVVPAMIFVAFNWRDGEALRGWAVPVATDIAFALAVMGMLGRRVPVALKIFLAALAIIDDLGAIVVIALFYTATLKLGALAGAGAVLLVLVGMSRLGLRRLWPFLAGGLLLWALVLQSGVHATLAGVAWAFAVPGGEPASRLERGLEPWVAFLVLPAFGVMNAGLAFDSLPPGAGTDALALGTGLGLLLGKQLGVFTAVSAAAWAGWARLPAGVTRLQLYGASVLCGIGFTMSLFIGELAFRGSARGDEVKLAVFVASLASAGWGLVVLSVARSRRGGKARG